MDGAPDHAKLLEDPEFRELAATRNRVSAILTVSMLLVYFGFILLVALGKGFLGIRLFGGVTLGIVVGIGVIVASWALTGLYVRWANNRYDTMVENIRRKAGHGA